MLYIKQLRHYSSGLLSFETYEAVFCFLLLFALALQLQGRQNGLILLVIN